MSAPNAHPFEEAEYTALRGEIVNYANMQSKIESLTLVAAGALIAASTSFPLSTYAFPVLAMFLATRWVGIGATIGRIANYVYQYCENDQVPPMWEHYLQPKPTDREVPANMPFASAGGKIFGVLGAFSTAGLFLGTQVVATLWPWIGYTPGNTHPAQVSGLLWVDIVAIVITVVALVAAGVVYGGGIYALGLRDKLRDWVPLRQGQHQLLERTSAAEQTEQFVVGSEEQQHHLTEQTGAAGDGNSDAN